MGLVLKYIEQTKSGSWQYRRRVPKDVAEVIAKREFKRKLGDSQRVALAAYPLYHAEVEREIAEAKLGRARTAAVVNAKLTESEAYAEALRKRADLVAAGATQEHLEIVADALADKYPQDEDGPLGVPPLDRFTINLLRDAPGKIKAPEPTLGDALRVYLKEHVREDDPDTDSRVVGLAKRVIGATISAMGRDPTLSSITRADARAVRDEMLDRVKVRGKGVGRKVSVATVSRELTIITAIINFAKLEFTLGENLQNPFNRLPMKGAVKGKKQKALALRDPLPEKVLTQVRGRISANASQTLFLIWRLIEGTGCRIAEITGLRVEDVQVSGDLPHIRIEAHDLRRLKTESSRRQVPLVGDALAAAKEALEVASDALMLFPDYGRNRGSDAASAALMKHIRTVSINEKHVIHSLRHNMKDRLILAEASSLDQDLILGHVLESVGDKVLIFTQK